MTTPTDRNTELAKAGARQPFYGHTHDVELDAATERRVLGAGRILAVGVETDCLIGLVKPLRYLINSML